MDRRGPGRPRETSHDEIRAVALALFVEQGYAATPLRQIAAAAGISRTTLFDYFPAKRDLVWREHDEGVERMRSALAGAGDVPLVELVVGGMLAYVRFGADEHAGFAQRRRIVLADEGLRAYDALAVEDLTALLATAAHARAPRADAELIEMVVRALVAAAARCTDRWVLLADPDDGLDQFVARRLRPVADALTPLLP